MFSFLKNQKPPNLLNAVNLKDILCLKIRQKKFFHKIKPVNPWGSNENLFAEYENTVFHFELESWNTQRVSDCYNTILKQNITSATQVIISQAQLKAQRILGCFSQ